MLEGDLAAGKTTFVSEVVGMLGGDPRLVTSPTFALHHVYELDQVTIDHMDLYRLENDFDLESSGFFEVVENNERLAFIEWSSRVGNEYFEKLDRDVFIIRMEVLESGVRKLDLKPLRLVQRS